MPPPPPPPSTSTGAGAGPPSEAGADKKSEKSYFASAVDSINPWTASRSTTPTPKDNAPPRSAAKPPATAAASTKKADDHSVNTLYGQSFRKYPPDCPPLNVMWFHAVDVPKRKPHFLRTKKENENPAAKPPPPKKFVAFSDKDSRRIENAYQKLLEDVEDERDQLSVGIHKRNESLRSRKMSLEGAPNTSIDNDTSTRQDAMRVPVNEDFLFDVDIEQRELAPVYWLGSVYEIRRGSWFYQEGSSLRPCEENLASQLEEGYLKTRPWAYPVNRGRSNSAAVGKEITPKASADNLRAASKAKAGGSLKAPPAQDIDQFQPQTYRLFGTYMNSVATYENHNTAWLSSEGVFSWVTSTVYQKFAGGSYMNGVKLVRGFSEPGKSKDGKGTSTPTTDTAPQTQADDKDSRALKRRSAPAASGSDTTGIGREIGEEPVEAETQESRLQREFSSYIENADDPDKQQETIRRREEQEIQDDYTAQDGETQGRDIEHLVLVTHGIGQLLGMRMESVNFVHDVNLLRKTMKGVYSQSADLKALNSESGDGPGNCKVQVLPVCWRHLLDFPKRRKKGERDIGDVFAEDDEYPSLEDITIEGVAFARSLISDLALDVLLYQSAYREQIAEIVLKESNRIYKLFRERNPEFKGKVHIVGHSLGSAIMFDILCRQREPPKPTDSLRNPLRFLPPQDKPEQAKDPRELAFDFSVDDLFCLGSPIGLFQMLKGRTVSARQQPHAVPSESPLNSDHLDDPFRGASAADQQVSPITGLPYTISSPKVSQLFNVFHPSDPIAYRVEPLISPAMSSLKPQALPYTKKGMFGAVAPQGLSGIGVKVGQSVSGLWSSFSAGIASSLLNRSLGLSSEDVANFNAANPTAATPAAPPNNGGNIAAQTPSGGSNPNAMSGDAMSDANAQAEKTDARKRALARQKSRSSASSSGATKGGATGLDTQSAIAADKGGSANPEGDNGGNATLIDDELETLYARFQKKRVEDHKRDGGDKNARDNARRASAAAQDFGEAWAAEELKAQKLRREELKVRALNRNGRVDYSIQESALDFNPINTIASHLQYWQDEDVSHFIVSQLLSNKGQKSGGNEAAAVPSTGGGGGGGLDSRQLK